jgi:hypothetical protein
MGTISDSGHQARRDLRQMKRLGGEGGLRTTIALGLALTACSSCAPGGAAQKAAATPDFGPNVLVFDPSMPAAEMQRKIDAVYAVQQHNEFGPQRNAFLFLPGEYKVTCRSASTPKSSAWARRRMPSTSPATCTPTPACHATTPPAPSGGLLKAFL